MDVENPIPKAPIEDSSYQRFVGKNGMVYYSTEMVLLLGFTGFTTLMRWNHVKSCQIPRISNAGWWYNYPSEKYEFVSLNPNLKWMKWMIWVVPLWLRKNLLLPCCFPMVLFLFLHFFPASLLSSLTALDSAATLGSYITGLYPIHPGTVRFGPWKRTC